jgi:hypothetical protein
MRGSGVESAGIDPERVAEVIATPSGPGPERRGSGYRVSPTSVLTAAHVVDGAARVRVRFNADRPGEWVADTTVAWADAEVDAAVLGLAPPAGEEAADPVGFGRVGERDAVIPVSAMGFPRFKLRQDQGGPSVYRDSAHAVGTVAVLANRRQGTLEVTVDPPERDPDPARSPWEGMSGAALWSGGRVVGLVAEHHRSDGLGRLAATRVDAWYERLGPERLERLRDLLALPARADELADVVPAPASELLQAGYLAQVRDLAPERLLEREAELEELVQFCAGEERYRWLHGPPWAGKSALAAWFVLHPPAGVTVVSFFVTRRLTGQTDSNAFTEAMVEQLAVVAGEPPAGSATPAGRDKARRHLLDQAARRVAERGQRLLLVIDGLDEDQGARPGSGLPSIASLLPARPPEAVRVLVTSRPHPGVPDDVGGDHPLRHCQPRLLIPSRAAGHIEVVAKDELYEQLHGDPVQVDLLGLITAGGGGFTLGELSLLSGQPGWALAGKLRSVFGRSLMARAPYDQLAAGTDERVLLFAHETLRAIAERELAADLGAYQARIDAWVDELRERGWPDDTPQYPLRPYGRLLAAQGELGRLVELATDPRRQERLLVATAGDGTAIAELTAAQNLALSQPLPDLEALGRLAVHKDHLAGRNQAVPVGLPALWVRLGRRQRGEALARALPSSRTRAEALAAVAVALAQDRRADRAEATARGITDPAVRAAALGGVAKVLARGDRQRAVALLEDAERTARGISTFYVWPLALGTVAEAIADAGFREWAERTVRDIPHPYAAAGDGALRSVAVALAEAGHWDQAEATARRVVSAMVRAEALAAVGKAMLAVDRDRGLALLEEAERGAVHGRSVGPDDGEPLRAVIRALLEVDPGRGPALDAALRQLPRRLVPEAWDGATRMVTLALADNGRWDSAGELAGGISHPRVRAESRRDLAEVMAVAGRWDDAERAARDIELLRVRSEALVAVAAAVGVQDRDRALALATDAEQLARQITVGSQDWTWHALAEAQAATGEWDLAERTADSIPEPYVRARALRALAGSLAGAGQWARAERTARGISDAGVRMEALAAVAEALVPVDRERALDLANEAEWPGGRPADVPLPTAQTLRSMAVVLASSGAWDRAERTVRAIVDYSFLGMAHQAEGFRAVVKALAEAREVGQLRRVALGLLEGRPGRFRALGTAAMALARVDRSAALALVDEAERIAGGIDRDTHDWVWASREVAEAWAALGRWDQAERQLGDVADADGRDEAALGLVEALRDAGELDRAERVARGIRDPKGKARALAALLEPMVAVDQGRARDLADEAEGLARALDEPLDQTRAYLDLSGRLMAASALQGATPDDPFRARAHRLLGALLAGPSWSEALVLLARLQPSALAPIGRALDQVSPA